MDAGAPAATSRGLLAGLVLLLAGVALRQLILHFVYEFYIDDSYVLMRYADNLAAGRGPVFNPGELVMGFSSPLFTYFAATLKLMVPFMPTTALVGVVNGILFVVLSFVLLRVVVVRRGVWWGFFVLWVLYSPFVDGSINGMETLLFVGLQFATVECFALGGRKGWNLGVVAAALVALTRPEGALFCAATLAYLVWRRPHPRPWLGVAIVIVLAVGWAAYATAKFGSVVPQSVVAKALPTEAGGHAQRASALDMLPILAFGLSSGVFFKLGPAADSVLLGLGLIAFAVFAVGTRELVRQRAPAVIFAASFLIDWVAFAVGNPVRVWSWYTVSIAFTFWYCTFAGLAPLTERRRFLQHAILAGTVVVSVASLALGIRSRNADRKYYSIPLRAIAGSILRDYHESQSIMLGDIGIIGYYTQKRIVDLAGLISPAALRRRPSGELLSYGELIRAERPDVVITTNDLLTSVVNEDAMLLRKTFLRSEDKADFERDYADRSADYLPFRHLYVRRSILNPAP